MEIDWNEHFYYDETSPSCLRWKRNAANNKVKKNDIAGVFIYKNKNKNKGYFRVSIFNVTLACHRIIYEIFNGNILENYQIDHIDRNTRNNNINNLRAVAPRDNCVNQTKHKTNTSSYTGVHLKDNGNGTIYWSAQWNDINKKRCVKNFSVKKFGYEKALELAIEYRKIQTELLKTQGVNYSYTHGE